MKLTKSYIASLLLLSGAFVACEDDPEMPPVYVPQATINANTTIADLKAAYWQGDDNYVTQIGTNADGNHIVVAGRIISNDEPGNIYKSLVIQDATGALAFSINQGDLYEDAYKLGQEIVVDLTNAYIGKYSGLQQIGTPGEYNGTPQADRMTFEEFEAMAQFNGMPDATLIDTITTTIGEINAAKGNAEGLRQWQSQLVRFDEVSFVDGGKVTFAEASGTTNRTLKDADGNEIIVRNSNYSLFASDTIPAGKGSVVGILSYFSSAGWQLLLRDDTDCIDFGGESVIPETPSTGGDGTAENPYGVADVLGGKTATGVWVTGYIVGWINTAGDKFEVSAETATFSVPATINTNLLMAASADETNVSKCIPVQLPSGAIRSDLNLVDNPGNLGKQVTLKCDITTYFSLNGLKNASIYTWGATGEEPTVAATADFKKVTAVTDGKSYLLVAGGNMALPLSGTYGYLKIEAVTDNGGVISTSTDNAFTIKATSNGYTIADAQGRYLYMKDDYNSFNVDASMPSEGAEWKIEAQTDGTFVITNILKSKSIQFDSQYNSYGSYPDVRGTMPALYEKVD